MMSLPMQTFRVFVLLLSYGMLINAQRPTFLSLDCGGEQAFVDGIGIEWVPDDKYIASGEKLAVSMDIDPGMEAYLTSRYFPDTRSKHCYVIPAEAGSTYLIRVVMMHGRSPLLPVPVSFNVTVNSNHWFTHDLKDIQLVNTAIVSESILYNERDRIDVCLSRPTRGIAWISSLEVRQWTVTLYNITRAANTFLHTLRRVNTGNAAAFIQWPEDEFDRVWYPSPYTNVTALSNDSVLTVPQTFSEGFNRPPQAVLADAAFASDKLELPVTFSRDVQKIYLLLYFQVIRNVSSVSETNPVNFFINAFNLSGNVSWNGIPFQVDGDNTVTSRQNKITITKQEGYSGDIFLNAFEVYEMLDVNSTFTLESDVSALQTLQTSLGLSSWRGDPCYPAPYDWIGCDESNRISVLYLSGYNLTGTIPSEISELSHLTEIYLNNNRITGTIPSSLSELSNLNVLSLDNNSLSGDVPSSLLKESFTFSGNPNLNLCQPTDVVCNGTSTRTDSKASSGSNTGLIIGIAAGVVAAVLLVGAGLCLLCVRMRKTKAANNIPTDKQQNGVAAPNSGQTPLMRSNLSSPSSEFKHNLNIHSVSGSHVKAKIFQVAGFMAMNEVVNATRNYQKKIGEGGYGPVYYGKLPNGREVAVKVNKSGANQGNDEFLNEVSLLTRVHHKNLVSLLGFCEEQEHRILVYEYLHNGTLSDLLYGPDAAKSPVSWKTRLELAIDAAKGLEYLHTGCLPHIIHRDVKSSNILIDDKMVARVSDFGISKSGTDLQTTTTNPSQVVTMVRGTPGYLDPEYYMIQKLSMKSDVYSFGVVLIEIISGRRPIILQPDGSQVSIVTLLLHCMQTGDILSLADPAIQGDFNPESMWKMAEIAWSSVEQKGAKRPTMTQVVQGLSEAYEMELTYDPNNPVMDSSFQLPTQR